MDSFNYKKKNKSDNNYYDYGIDIKKDYRIDIKKDYKNSEKTESNEKEEYGIDIKEKSSKHSEINIVYDSNLEGWQDSDDFEEDITDNFSDIMIELPDLDMPAIEEDKDNIDELSKSPNEYLKNCKAFLSNNEYDKAISEINKAISVSSEKEKNYFINEKIKFIKSDEYLNYFRNKNNILFKYYKPKELIDIGEKKCNAEELVYIINKVFSSPDKFESIDQFIEYEKYIKNRIIIKDYIELNIEDVLKNIKRINFNRIIKSLCIEDSFKRYNITQGDVENILLKYIDRSIKNNQNHRIFIKNYLELSCKSISRESKVMKVISVLVKNEEAKELIDFIEFNGKNKRDMFDKYIYGIGLYIRNNSFIEIELLEALLYYMPSSEEFDYNKLRYYLSNNIKGRYKYKGILAIIMAEININILKEYMNKWEKKEIFKESMSYLKYAKECTYREKTFEYHRIIYIQIIKLHNICNKNTPYKNIAQKNLNKIDPNVLKESKVENKVKNNSNGNKGLKVLAVITLCVSMMAIAFISSRIDDKEPDYGNKNSNNKQEVASENNNYEEDIESKEETAYEEDESNDEGNLPVRYSTYEDYDDSKKSLYTEIENAMSEYYSDYEQAMYYGDYSYVRDDVADGSPLSNELKNRLPKNDKVVYVKHFYIYNLEDHGYSAEFNMDTVFIIDNSKIQIETRKYKIFDSKYIDKWVLDSLSNFDIIYQQEYDPNFDFENYRDYL